MARFARIEMQIRANRLILANRFRVPELRKNSRKLETVDFEKHPARKVGTSSRQCEPKVPGRFAFAVARNPRICGIWRFGKFFPAIFPGLASRTPARTPETPQPSQRAQILKKFKIALQD